MTTYANKKTDQNGEILKTVEIEYIVTDISITLNSDKKLFMKKILEVSEKDITYLNI
jgi:hypothetical protein